MLKPSCKYSAALLLLFAVVIFVVTGCTTSKNAGNTVPENSGTPAVNDSANTQGSTDANANTNAKANANTNDATDNANNAPAQKEIKTFNLVAKNFSFTPNKIKVKKGDHVKIVLKSEQGFHDWVIDEFNARTDRVQDGQTAETEFTADKTGEFEFYCSVGEHRKLGMVGKLIVE